MSQLVLYFLHSTSVRSVYIDVVLATYYSKFPQKSSHSSPVKARYGASFVYSDSDLYSASITVVLYVV